MNRHRYEPSNMLLELIMIAVAIGFFFPVYILVLLSFKPQNEIATSPLSFPRALDFSNYAQAWSSASLGSAIISSTIVTISSVIMLVTLGSLASYALARRQQRMSYGLYILFLLGIILPFQLALIPLYSLMRDLHLLGTYVSLLIFYTGLQLPFTVFLYTGFLRALPRGYEEAALVDGATHLRAFMQVVFPLLRPVTGTVIILNAIFIWNDFLTPLLYVGGTTRETIPVSIFAFVGQFTAQWGIIFAGLIIGLLPMIGAFFLLQRYIIKGFTSGLKG